MKRAYIKDKHNMYFVSESETLVIFRGNKKYISPFESIKECKQCIKRISKNNNMKNHIPFTIETI